jgi:hypothetical protein
MKLQIASFLTGLNKKQKMLFYAAVFFIVLALLDRIIFAPILSRSKGLDRQIESEEETIKRNLTILSRKESLSGDIEKYSSYLSEAETEEKEVTNFSREVENMAKEASVYLVGIRPAGKVEEGITKKYFLELDFEAKMEQLFEFFYAIENANVLTKIEMYYITPKSTESSIATCNMRVSKVIIPK